MSHRPHRSHTIRSFKWMGTQMWVALTTTHNYSQLLYSQLLATIVLTTTHNYSQPLTTTHNYCTHNYCTHNYSQHNYSQPLHSQLLTTIVLTTTRNYSQLLYSQLSYSQLLTTIVLITIVLTTTHNYSQPLYSQLLATTHNYLQLHTTTRNFSQLLYSQLLTTTHNYSQPLHSQLLTTTHNYSQLLATTHNYSQLLYSQLLTTTALTTAHNYSQLLTTTHNYSRAMCVQPTRDIKRCATYISPKLHIIRHTKEPLNIRHFYGKWLNKIRHPMQLRHPVDSRPYYQKPSLCEWYTHVTCTPLSFATFAKYRMANTHRMLFFLSHFPQKWPVFSGYPQKWPIFSGYSWQRSQRTREYTWHLAKDFATSKYRVANTHRMPHLDESFSAQVTYIQWLFCGKWSAT